MLKSLLIEIDQTVKDVQVSEKTNFKTENLTMFELLGILRYYEKAIWLKIVEQSKDNFKETQAKPSQPAKEGEGS